MTQQLDLTFTINEKVELTTKEREEYKALTLCALAQYREIADTDDVNRIDAIQDFFGQE